MSRRRKKNPEEDSHQNDGKLLKSVRNIFESNPSKTFSPNHVARKLFLKGKKRLEQATQVLLALEVEGVLTQVDPLVFKYKVAFNEFVTGTVDHVNARFAFVLNDKGPDIKVSGNNLLFAMNGDLVNVGVFPNSRGKNPEGQVISILERKQKEITGVVMIEKNFAFVKPDGRKLHNDIYISNKNLNGAIDGNKVLVRITEFPRENFSAEGAVVKVLGKPGDHETEIFSIMNEFSLPTSFPKKVNEEAEDISENIPQSEIDKRKDYRGVTTFTIDPLDAKDFDDAISFKKLENGNLEIGVHIADVSHYVEEGTLLDDEALERATSVYLVDRVVPMLPEKISNILCSLRPHEDKLAFSVIYEITPQGTIKKEWFGRTVIYSDRRFTYEEAQEVIETQDGDYVEEITTLNTLAKGFRKKRFKNGAINFETPEVRIQLDEENKPIGVVPRIRVDAHKLVEEFMLMANKSVATHVFGLKAKYKKTPVMVYRVHEEPDPEKLTTFSNFARRFGYDVDTENIAPAINGLIEEIEGKPEEHVLQNLAIRAMSKAKYTTDNYGHFGLAFNFYTHFTSPIRRYPDLIVHRLLDNYLRNGKIADKEHIEDMCKHSSMKEKNAADAERASIKFKQVEFMATFGDQELNGVISGVTENGFYVEIDDIACEGMVRIADLKGDYYVYEPENIRLLGSRKKETFTFGEKVIVKVLKTNLLVRTVDLEFIAKR